MKERPILFSTEMVQALLAGRKTKTRRTKWLDAEINQRPQDWQLRGKITHIKTGTETFRFHNVNPINRQVLDVKCPYGQPGDVLWVREAYRYIHLYPLAPFDTPSGKQFIPEYRADKHPHVADAITWMPSIFMPKPIARIWLLVIDSKPERLWDITENDAKAEGVRVPLINVHPDVDQFKNNEPNYRTGFAKIWINLNEIDSWKKNPWLWAITFKVISTTGYASYAALMNRKEVAA